jgi:hypothetical protein
MLRSWNRRRVEGSATDNGEANELLRRPHGSGAREDHSVTQRGIRSFVALSSEPADHDRTRLSAILTRLGAGPGSRAWALRLTAPTQNRLATNLDDTRLSLGPIMPLVAVGLEIRVEPDMEESPVHPRELLAAFGWDRLWAVETHVRYGGAVDPDSGHIYRFAIAKRARHLDHAGFVAHYLDRHAPLVLRSRPLFDRYVVSVIEESDSDVADAAGGGQWDAIAEQRFADHAQWAEHDRQLFEEKPAVRADLGRFLGGIVQFSGSRRIEVHS